MASKKRVWVVGLSDIGRSPRLQNHAVSLAEQGSYLVDVIGHRGSSLLPALERSEDIAVHYVPNTPAALQGLPRLLALPLKALAQALLLLRLLLFGLTKPDLVLLQVPPAIPTLLLCWLVCLLRGAVLVVDWHNFAYTLMALSLGGRHPLVHLAQAHEAACARLGAAHLCVSRAMQAALAQRWGVRAAVFADRAPAAFRKASLAEAHELLLRLAPELERPMHPRDCCSALGREATDGQEEPAPEPLPEVLDALWSGGRSPGSSPPRAPTPAKQAAQSLAPDAAAEATLCTARRGKAVALRADRPALVVSSTSWTPDEDFSILLEAALQYDAQACAPGGEALPRLLVLVTGRGPQRAAFLARLRNTDLRKVAFRSLWLEPADYPRLLGCCDLGVSLHTSSSGLDLPMKAVDMLGCGLPVLAAAYPAIGELVAAPTNGRHFSSPAELARLLADCLAGFPADAVPLRGMALAIAAERQAGRATWESEWAAVVLPLVRRQLSQ